MMPTNNRELELLDLDHALAEAERQAPAQALRAARRHLGPRPEVTQGLELRLRRVAQAPRRPIWRRVQPERARLAFAGLAASVALVALLSLPLLFGGGTPTAAAAEILQKAEVANAFVPAGQVRHLVISATTDSTVADARTFTSTEEVWLANGERHLLLRKTAPAPFPDVLIGEQRVWVHQPPENTVYQLAYDPRFLAEYVPNQQLIGQLLQHSGTRLAGTTTLNGREVLVLERVTERPPADLPLGDDVIDARLWIDPQTYRVVQWQSINRQVLGGRFTGKEDTTTRTITLDEVRDAGQFPAELFTFTLPPGTQLKPVENPAIATPTPLRRP
jgi:hypothetical protein